MFWPDIPRSVRTVLCGLALVAFGAVNAAAQPDTRAGITMIRLMAPGNVNAAGVMLDKDALCAFYVHRRYALAWDDDHTGLGARATAVFDILASADSEGLDPADYHIREIAALAAAATDVERLDRDLLLTDGLIHYASDVAGGKLTSRQTDERFVDNQSLGLPEYLASAAGLDAPDLAALLVDLAPSAPEYRALKQMLARLQPLAESGGWLPLPDGPSLHPGERDPSVPALRQRLTEQLHAVAATDRKHPDDLYDPALRAAVALFQSQHGIKPDGVLGNDTRAALDLPADARLRQTVVNMERLRWSDIPPSGRAVEVNLAAYSLNVYQDGKSILTMPVVVGSRENPTPMIASLITTVVLNPNWTLPPNVIKEMLPRIRGDAAYLAAKGIAREEVGGRVRLVQPPGPSNPLGHYKFIMPNDQDIYLHDSPDVAKFRYALRAYSHGCIRLGNPAGLAALLLDDRVASLPDGLDALVQTGETRHVKLTKPVPVSLVYRTAWLDGDGHLVMGQDGYGRDIRLWKTLQKAHPGSVRKVAQSNAMAG